MPSYPIPSFIGRSFANDSVEGTATMIGTTLTPMHVQIILEEYSMCAAEVCEGSRLPPHHQRWVKCLQLAWDIANGKPVPKKLKSKKPLTRSYKAYNGEIREAYTMAGLAAIKPLLEKARVMVAAKVEEMRGTPEAMAGTCVLGAGITLAYFPARCRNPRHKLVLTAPFQGCIATQAAVEPAMEWLKSQGVVCHYDAGNMD